MNGSDTRAWSGPEDRELQELLLHGLGPEAVATALGRDVPDVLARMAYLTGQSGKKE